MDINAIVISVVSMGGLGAVFSIGLSIANNKLKVDEDPRIALVQEQLPNANCGGCGRPGCAKFAECVVTGQVTPSQCPVCSEDAIISISQILGVEASMAERKIARIFCQGGEYETAKKGVYNGIQSCIAATFAGGGDKLCSYGCIGFGDCVKVCPFNAMYMNNNGLPVVIDEKCTGCGICVEACPRELIELHPESHKLFVLCKNQDPPKEARKICTRACVACGICVRLAGAGNMVMQNNLAVINYEVYGNGTEFPIDKCPTDGMVILDSTTEKQVAASA
jgi:electron transport complex protein RnfB